MFWYCVGSHWLAHTHTCLATCQLPLSVFSFLLLNLLNANTHYPTNTPYTPSITSCDTNHMSIESNFSRFIMRKKKSSQGFFRRQGNVSPPPPLAIGFPYIQYGVTPWICICPPPPLKFAAMHLPPLERNPEITLLVKLHVSLISGPKYTHVRRNLYHSIWVTSLIRTLSVAPH